MSRSSKDPNFDQQIETLNVPSWDRDHYLNNNKPETNVCSVLIYNTSMVLDHLSIRYVCTMNRIRWRMYVLYFIVIPHRGVRTVKRYGSHWKKNRSRIVLKKLICGVMVINLHPFNNYNHRDKSWLLLLIMSSPKRNSYCF